MSLNDKNPPGIDQVREALERPVDVDPLDDQPQPDNNSAPREPEFDDGGPRAGAGYDAELPDGFPCEPLGQCDGVYHFLTARNQVAAFSASALNSRANIFSLVSGSPDPIASLAAIAPPDDKKDAGFNVPEAADLLMMACDELPLFDPGSISIRHCGTWRGKVGPVVHVGERLISSSSEERRGRYIGSALYPTRPAIAGPAAEAADVSEIALARDYIKRSWAWLSPDTDADLLIGWIGQAILGQYPTWRTHCYIQGRLGSGKSTLLRIIDRLLGGMSGGVASAESEASVRQMTNRMAVVRILDEAEATGDGRLERVIELFRLMSGADGARVGKGTADHKGVRFELFGAGLMGAIVPGIMSPQDRSRFLFLTIGERPETGEPEVAAKELARIEAEVEVLGPRIWRRMVNTAAARWDATFTFYSALVQGWGSTSRVGDTVGAVLAGWDLMLFDSQVTEGAIDKKRLARAEILAAPLIAAHAEAAEEGEGEKCLRAIMASVAPSDFATTKIVGEVIARLIEGSAAPGDAEALGRMGLRLFNAKGGLALFVVNDDPTLTKALAGTHWVGGGHRAALMTLDGVERAERPVRVAKVVRRGIVVPDRYLPGWRDPDFHPNDVVS